MEQRPPVAEGVFGVQGEEMGLESCFVGEGELAVGGGGAVERGALVAVPEVVGAGVGAEIVGEPGFVGLGCGGAGAEGGAVVG